MARVPLPPEPGDSPGTVRYKLDNVPDLPAQEIVLRVKQRKAEKELIRSEDIGNVPMHGEYLDWNTLLLQERRRENQLQLNEWYKTEDGKLYKFLQDLSRDVLRARYKNPKGSYAGTINSQLGSTKWAWNTGSGWSEPTLHWSTNSNLWRLTHYDGWHLLHQRKRGSNWEEITHEHLKEKDLEDLCKALMPILEKISWH